MDILKVKVNGQWVPIPAIAGPRGPKGDDGNAGPQGPSGPQGERGLPGQGVPSVTSSDNGKYLQVVDGEWSAEYDSAIKVAETDEDNSDLDIADAQGNVLARFSEGHVETKKFHSKDLRSIGFEYLFDNGTLYLSYGYNNTHDAVIGLNCGRANGLFDFSVMKLKPVDISLKDAVISELPTVWTSTTDMHGPFQFNVTNNADGYYAQNTDPGFVGGNHKVAINGVDVATAQSIYVQYYADGKPVTSGNGRCAHFEIRWANDIQAYNCVKADGSGRTSMREVHEMIFDGVSFDEEVTLVPFEEIKMQLWYGFQSFGFGTVYENISFIDGANRRPYSSSDQNITSGNAKTSGMVLAGSNHCLKMTVDITCDLGKRDFYNGTNGAFVSSGKSYFYIIGTQVVMTASECYFLRGSYRFYPQI